MPAPVTLVGNAGPPTGCAVHPSSTSAFAVGAIDAVTAELPVVPSTPLVSVVSVTAIAAYCGNKLQSEEKMLVFQPAITDVSGTNEPGPITLLRTVTPLNTPEKL